MNKSLLLTPVEKRGTHYYKRDDEFVVNGVCGGKARVAYSLIERGIGSGVRSFVTCGSRDSRQCEVVAKICEHFGVESHLFMPSGKDTDVIESISATKGATLHRTKVGYNSVLVSHSQAFATENGFGYLPFGLETGETIIVNMEQVRNIPSDVKRIVIPCGGGMNMISVIKGLEYTGRYDVHVTGVVVGKRPDSVFERFLGSSLFYAPKVTWDFVYYPSDYHVKACVTSIDGLELDPIYEAKCIPFLEDGDLMWIVGKKI